MNKNPAYIPEVLLVVVLILIGSLAVPLLSRYKLDTSALLYVGLPILISTLLIFFTSARPNNHWKNRYWNNARYSLIIMLGSSILLFEGFICILMYMPIHFLIFSIVYLFHKNYKENSGKLNSHVLPIILIIISLEGTHSSLSYERYNEVSATQIVNISIKDIKNNLIKPIKLDHDRHWFLEIFPMPYQINAGTLNEGDIHEIYFRYHRWFFTNTHEGKMLLKIHKVDENTVETEFVKDSSYISTYLELLGTTIQFNPIDEINTRVTLSIRFNRKLDPAWYFAPLERYGIKQTAKYLISDIISRQ